MRPHVRTTPLEHSPYLSGITGANVFLKLENLQITGSFKVRGAVNKVLSLSDKGSKVLIAASTGNHAAAVGFAANIANLEARVIMPATVSSGKVEHIKQYKNVTVEFYGTDAVDAEVYAREYAESSGAVYLSPYNDWQIIGGQGTIGAELTEQLPEMDAILVPVGGGGLISGIAGIMKSYTPAIEIIGCQPENSAVMYHSLQAGKILEMPSEFTVSDGTAGGIEAESITFDICRSAVERFHLVSEKDIMNALFIMLSKHQLMVEGAAGLSIASLIRNKNLYKGKNVVLIVCGNKMSMTLLEEVLKIGN